MSTVTAASTKVSIQRRSNFAFVGMRDSGQQLLRGNDDAGNAVAALNGLFFDECLLQYSQFARGSQALERRDLTLRRHGRRNDA